MDSAVKLFAFAGALRRDSLNRKLIGLAAEAVRSQGVEVDLAEFSEFEMPLYSGDIEVEAGIPKGARRLGERLAAADGLMLASPEYNYSIPGPLKNAIDWISRMRPMPLAGLPVLLMAASPSTVGGERGLAQLRVPLTALGCHIYPHAFLLPAANEQFDASGELADAELSGRFEALTGDFLSYLEKLRS
jgi:chromate reductase